MGNEVSPSLSGEQFTWPITVYYDDTDVSGVVYHANYLRWFEHARTEWLRSRALGQEAMRVEHNIAFTVANITVAFLKPAKLDDFLEVVTMVIERRKASVNFSQLIRRKVSPLDLLCKADVRVACVDANTFKPRALPEIRM